ncbi:hypothetical protein [Cellulophaga baltica]|uniref:Uncharacterized protein n=1 Tax=Cellulophaga baltica TaxID=76594 RepID=A0A1G7HQ69_9FLAO|nr:hypothetical protein [Cellulophaga baltica]SDF02603.1 hypothetical protein SAMN04487992_106213 [Cellulophaga baltica]
MWNIARNTSAKLLFYGNENTLKFIKDIKKQYPIECSFETLNDWDNFLIIAKTFFKDDNIIIVLSRKEQLSYHRNMSKIPTYLNTYFKKTSCILIYPMQSSLNTTQKITVTNPSLMEPLEKLEEISKTIAKLFTYK